MKFKRILLFHNDFTAQVICADTHHKNLIYSWGCSGAEGQGIIPQWLCLPWPVHYPYLPRHGPLASKRSTYKRKASLPHPSNPSYPTTTTRPPDSSHFNCQNPTSALIANTCAQDEKKQSHSALLVFNVRWSYGGGGGCAACVWMHRITPKFFHSSLPLSRKAFKTRSSSLSCVFKPHTVINLSSLNHTANNFISSRYIKAWRLML